MQLYRVVEDTSYGASNKLSAQQFMGEMQYAVTQAHGRIPQILEDNYCWYRLDNKQEALEQMEAILIALQMKLPAEVQLHLEQIVYLVTKDMVMRTTGLAFHRLGYQGSLKYQYYSHARESTFTVPIFTKIWDREKRDFVIKLPDIWDSQRTDWVFKPIQEFTQVVPLHALKAMRMLADEGIQPDAYWVADKVETVDERQRSLDPILCARFGQWFTGIAMWL